MSIGLTFEVAAPPLAAAPNRTDIACFIGYVARRPGVPLPDTVLAQLREAGWYQGPWQPAAAALDSALQLPIAVDSWNDFARIFAWGDRQVNADGTLKCATYLGAAVRSFFARGGRRAVIVRAGDPWPYFEGAPLRATQRIARMRALIPDFPGIPAALPFDRLDPRTWRGLHHVYGLADCTLIVIPDLPDVCAIEPPTPPVVREPPVAVEGFVECSIDEPLPPEDNALARIAAPRSDADGYAAWQLALDRIRRFLTLQRRDCLFVGALPLPLPDTRATSGLTTAYAERALIDFLRAVHVFEPAAADGSVGATAFAQLGWPWLETRRSADLPQTLEPPDGVLTGAIAAAALERGTFRSVAGTVLNDVLSTFPDVSWGEGSASPTGQLAERVCLIAPEPQGWTLISDVTTASDRAWRPAGVSRLLASILRAARRTGEGLLFEPNGPGLWGRVRRAMEELLTDYWHAGGLRGASTAEAFEVRCDRSTMSQNDIDNGRLVAQIIVTPAAAIEAITVVLALQSGGAVTSQLRGVA